MEQLIKRKKKPFVKLLTTILAFVILVDFIIFLINRYIEDLSSYISTILTILLVVTSCSHILIKYFSDYLYLIEGNQILFYRVIGRKRFLILKIGENDLISIRPYDNEEKYHYNFTFDKRGEGVYMGTCHSNNKRLKFLFAPNEHMLSKLRKMGKTRSEKNG